MIPCLGGYMGKDIFSKKSRFSIRKLNIGVCSVLLGTLIMIGHTAQADETTSDGATVATTAVSASQGDGASTTTPPITAPESAATTTVAPAATETVTSMSVAPTTSVAPSVAVSSEAPASTSATSSAPASSAATSTSPVVASEVPGSTNVSTAKPATASEASRSVTASTASVTTASSENAIANNVTVSETANVPRVRRRRDTGGTSRSVDETRLDRVTVTKDNFDSFFKEGGTANYDETSGTIKLTDDVSGQVGSAYLRFKIDPREDFTFTGKVDIGDKYEGHTVGSRPGGDGVGFVFHTGNVDTIGQSGASIGMGTIKNAFGFKLDSWHNTSNPNANQNASADPRYGGNAWRSNAFGSFYSSNNAGRVTTSSSAAKALNPAPSGQWVDFKIEYKGQSKEFIVTYGSEKWSTNLKTANASIMEPTAKTALNNSNATYALSFLGSTGSGTNLQRVQIEKFEFTAPQIVQVAFYDEAGNELAASSAIPGDRDQVVNLSNIEAVQKAITKLKTKGYTLKEVNSDKAETYNSGANTVTLRSGGQLLKYVFAVPTPEVTKTLPSDGGMLRNGGIKSTDRTLSGTGTPGATINIKVAGNTVVDNVTVESNGKWTATLPTGLNSNVTTQDQLVPKDSLVVTQKIGVSESEAATVDVALGESSVVPSTESKDQQSIVAETTTVTLKVPHDAGVTYFDYPKTGGRSEVAIKRDSIPGAWASKDASKAVVTSYSTDGFVDTIVLEMKEQIQPGKAKVISNIKETKYSSPVGWKEINVEEKPDTTPPVAPTVNSVKVGATNLTGTAEANSTVEATLPNGSKVTATAGSDGSFTIPVSGLNEGDTISVTATDAASNKSTPSVVTVKENVRPVVNIPYDDKANQIIYLYSGEENNIELKVTDNSGKIAKAFLVFAQDNRTGLGTEDAGYLNGKTKSALYLKANRFGSETTATEANPAIIKLTANIPNGSYTDGTGMTRYIYAEDLAGNTNYDSVGAAGDTGAPGRIRFVWKPQTFKYNVQAPSTPIVTNTVPSAADLANAVKVANPTFSDKIDSVTLNGTNVTVTYKDGSTDTLSAASVFDIEAVAPSVTPVKNPSSLTTPEKDAVKAAVKVANPDATTVVVGNDGSTTLTYSNGSTANLTPAQTVKAADANGVQEPAAKTPVQNTSALTQPEKDAVKSAVETANPSATKVEVGDNGDTTVTFPDGTTATLTGDKTVYVSENGELPDSIDLPKLIITKWVDENGNELKPTDAKAPVELGGANEALEHGEIEGYVFDRTVTDKVEGTVTHIFKRVKAEADTTAPTAPVVNTVKAGDTAVTGTAEAGSTVEVTLPDGSKVSTKADQDGNYSVPVSGLKEGDTVSVTATDEAGNKSDATTATVAKADDKTAPLAPVVNTVKAGDTVVTGTAEAGSTVEVTLPDGTKATATADQDGNFSVPVSALKENDTVSVTAKDASNNTSTPTTVTVPDTTAPVAPTVNPVTAGATAVTGTAEAGSTVEVTLPDGTKATATADQDGNFSVPVSGLEEGQTVSVTAKDASNNTSAPTTATVAKADDKTAPDAPVVNPVKAGDTAVTGTAEAGSTVEVTLPDGTKATATADQDGNFSVPVSGLEEGQTVSVTAKDASNNTSTPTTATVAKADDKTAPAKPVVDTDLTGKAGTRTPIDVIAEPGTKIELFDKDGNKIGEATADDNGKATIIPTVDIPEGNVTARATDSSGNVSDVSAPMLATRGGSTETFNNGKGSDVTPTVVKPSPAVDVQAVDSSDKHMNLKARATISAAEKDASTLPATGEEASTAAVVLGGVLAAFGLTLAGKRKKED